MNKNILYHEDPRLKHDQVKTEVRKITSRGCKICKVNKYNIIRQICNITEKKTFSGINDDNNNENLELFQAQIKSYFVTMCHNVQMIRLKHKEVQIQHKVYQIQHEVYQIKHEVYQIQHEVYQMKR